VAAPGILSFSVIRGIQFDQVILQCRDDKLLVSGDAFLNVLGTYVPSGTFNSKDLYVKAGNPVWFIYFHSGLGTYIITQLLTTGGVTDYLVRVSDCSPMNQLDRTLGSERIPAI